MTTTTAAALGLAVGDTGPTVTHELTRTDLVVYAGASGDFNPMHHDEVKAQAAGMPSVFGHGMLSMGIVGRALTDWVGLSALRAFSVRFTAQTWPGDTLTTSLTVTAVDADAGTADIACALTNQDGIEVVSGTATVATA